MVDYAAQLEANRRAREKEQKRGSADWASSDSSVSDGNEYYPEQEFQLYPYESEGNVLEYTLPRFLFRVVNYSVHLAADGTYTDVNNLENMFFFVLDRMWLLTVATVTAIRLYADTKCSVEFLWQAVLQQMTLRGNMDHATFLYKTKQIDEADMMKRTVAFLDASEKLYAAVGMAPRHAHNATSVGFDGYKLQALVREHNQDLAPADVPLPPKSVLNVDTTKDQHYLFKTSVLYNPQPTFTLVNNALGLSLTQYMYNNSLNHPNPVDATRILWKKIHAAYEPLVTSNVEGIETVMTDELKTALSSELRLGEILYNRGTIMIKDVLGIHGHISRPLMGVQLALLRKAIADAPSIVGVVE